MSYKLLLADDSEINQKVVKKTLANEPFEIVVCSQADKLTESLKESNPDIVLLDFNLSESKTGYELCQDIKELNPRAQVIMLYATFDNIDEEALKKAGGAQKVIKPFDSNKFIALCRSFIPDEKSEPFEIKTVEKQSIIEEKPIVSIVKEEWEMVVPGVIGEEENNESMFPPIIESLVQDHDATNPEIHFPQSDDLDYPEEINSELKIDKIEQKYEPKSKLIPLQTLKETDSNLNEFNFEESNEELEKIKFLEEQIKDEVAANLWKADEVVEVKNKSKVVQDEYSHISFDTGEVFTATEVPIELTVELKKFIEEKIKEHVKIYFEKSIDQKIWESIPQVAEKVISQELSKISKNLSDSF
jgi:CheY-like chemotaxis protein